VELDPGELVALPAGTVRLHDARRAMETEVRLEPFEIARTTVVSAGSEQPVHGVTWRDAINHCNALSDAEGLRPAYTVEGPRTCWDVSADGYRLPTEAEWEYACRAGTTGPQYGRLRDIAWTARDEIHGIQPVGRKRPNAFGLSDLLGNVWEWCWDYLDPGRYADYRVFRGGGWADEPWSVRASVRRGSAPGAALEATGFRVARGAVAEPGCRAAQGWSAAADRARAGLRGPLPTGWTPLRELLDEQTQKGQG